MLQQDIVKLKSYDYKVPAFICPETFFKTNKCETLP